MNGVQSQSKVHDLDFDLYSLDIYENDFSEVIAQIIADIILLLRYP